ncbi:MAG: rhomboid family intramembrane serine protease [Clostridiales bacterium]|nr:rhomboid family intramembrane serine protease [Clostridiales bacterium]
MGTNWINKLERKWGKYALQNLSLYLLICYAFGYLISMVNPSFISYLTLNPYMILHGQVWRLVTWILVPPYSFDLLVIITLLFYYSIGTTLERTWGTFRYNLYLFSGMLFTILGSFIVMGFLYVVDAQAISMVGADVYFSTQFMGKVFHAFSTYYVNMSIFLAFAVTFPDVQVLLMFIIPVRMKWMGIAYGAWLVLQVISGNFVIRVVIAASLLNFVVFFLSTRNMMRVSPKQIKRRQDFKREVRQATGVTKHKCAICGRTEKDDPTLEFRFCSKCEGNYEYCQEHLFTHEHVKRS